MAKKDNIYKVGNFNDLPFSFNKEVAEVFEDMVDRSVPGYRSSLKLIENLGKKYFQNNSFCYILKMLSDNHCCIHKLNYNIL